MKFVILCCILFALTLTDHASGKKLVKEIKVFDAIDLTNAKDVVPTTGKNSDSPAYKFGPNTDHLIVNVSASSIFVEQAFWTDDFTVSAFLKTNSSGQGAILSLDAKAGSYFTVYFSWTPKGDSVTLTVAYIASGGSDYPQASKTIPVPGLLKNQWLSVSARVHTREKFIRFAINDKYFGQLILVKALDRFPIGATLRLAQEAEKGGEAISGLTNQFVGDLQNVIISFGSPNCSEITVILPSTSAPAPTPKPTAPTPKPTCPTQPTVVSNKCEDESGKMHNDKEKWNEGLCVKCVCKMGTARCLQFCKVCTLEGKFYLQGSKAHDRSCEEYVCDRGTMKLVSNGASKVRKTRGCERTCDNPQTSRCPHKEYNGCFCPGEMVMNNGKCQYRVSCSCRDNGKTYPPGKMIHEPCRFCTCVEGTFNCLKIC